MAHTYLVTVDGTDGDEWDETYSGTVEACVEPPTTTTPEVPTTTTPCVEELVVGAGEATPTTSAGTCLVSAASGTVPAAPVAAPAAAAPNALAAVRAPLPATGTTHTALIVGGGVLLLAGAVMWLAARRPAT